MKIKRLIPLMALVVCMLVLFVSCGSMKFDQAVVNTSTPEYRTEVKEIDEYDSPAITVTAGNADKNIVIFAEMDTDEVTYYIYNLETGKEVKSFSYDIVDLSALGGMPIQVDEVITVAELDGEEVVYTHYSLSGGKIVGDLKSPADFVNDCLVNGTDVWRLDEKTLEVTEKFEVNVLSGGVPECDDWNNQYYYDFSGDSVVVYDKKYNYVSSYTAPSYASADFHLFNDGYIVCQYLYAADPTGDKYDYIDGDGDKFFVETVRINPENGKASKINTKYMIEGVADYKDVAYLVSMLGINVSDDLNLNPFGSEKFDTLVALVEMDDKRIDESEPKLIYMNCDSKLSGTTVSPLDGDRNAIPVNIGNGYVIAIEAVANDARAWLLNADGDVIGEITGAEMMTSKYIITDSVIYDYSLNAVGNAKDKGYEFRETLFGGKPLYSKENSDGEMVYYTFDGSFKELYNSAEIIGTFKGILYGMENSRNGNYDYYDVTGDDVFTSVAMPASMAAETADYIVVKAYDKNANPVFYMINKQ